jgi:hypothetical protein
MLGVVKTMPLMLAINAVDGRLDWVATGIIGVPSRTNSMRSALILRHTYAATTRGGQATFVSHAGLQPPRIQANAGMCVCGNEELISER